ncbi:MSP7-like protein [Plasmodium vinckei vinckei]|uniref:MSP7-like protein n=1 Tax=Plasmodium vinckei vinckei TaxID=54757 RepID=A0A449BYX4_PLAVN|nr:MSP7-like protein [Plasmodium vinckei vinckei]KEG04932.1 hypothetical protein YYE_00507 [Plasmodium vinckei vinckei]VEV58581.1 MSP7-like protein [Plasmodium vinckei vinckei]
MAAYKKLYFLAILALFFKAVSADDFSNNDDDENVSDIINILKNKNHDLYNNPNYISDIKKKFQLLKKQIDQMNKYEKGVTSGEIGNILEEESEEESDENSNADKIVFGMSEDDLDNYDDDFWGQGAKNVIPVPKDGDASGAAVVEGNADPAPKQEGEENKGDQGTQKTQGTQGVDGTSGASGASGTQDAKGSEGPQGPEGTPGAKGAQGDQVSSENPPNGEGQGNNGTSQKAEGQVNSETSQNPGSQGNSVDPQNPQTKVDSGAQEGAKEGDKASLPAEDSTPGKTAFLGTIFDDMLKEQNGNTTINNSEYHSKYNDLKTECDLSMSTDEYDIAKKLISTYFSGTTEHPIKLYDILVKAITDEEYKKHFKNFIYVIYSFAKKYNYLSKTRLEDENKQFITNVLNILTTVDLK